MSLGNSTHTYIQHETLLLLCVSYQLHWGWREKGHWPNICQVFLRTALMQSINRASFCFMFRYFLMSDENSGPSSLRGKTLLPRVPGSYYCVSVFAVSQETWLQQHHRKSGFSLTCLSGWLCPDASYTGNTSVFQSLDNLLSDKIKLCPVVSHANKGNVRKHCGLLIWTKVRHVIWSPLKNM